MKFNLIDNGLDSLGFGIHFYKKYLDLDDKYDDSNPGYLKMAVISIHNAIELFSKQLLVDINEILIYKNLDSNILLKVLAHQTQKRESGLRDIPIDWSLVAMDANVHTINYSLCIARLETIFELTEEENNTLNEISKVRNKLTHFGIDKTLDFHEILQVINDSLELITQFFYTHLKDDNNKNYLEKFYDDLCDVIEEADIVLEEHWATQYAQNFEKINYTLDDIKEKGTLSSNLKLKKLNIEFLLGEYIDSPNLTLNIKSSETNFSMNITTYHIPRSDVTLFIDSESELIYFFIDHSKMILEENEPMYVYKTPKDYSDSMKNDVEYWNSVKKHKKNIECTRKDFDELELEAEISTIIDNTLLSAK